MGVKKTRVQYSKRADLALYWKFVVFLAGPSGDRRAMHEKLSALGLAPWRAKWRREYARQDVGPEVLLAASGAARGAPRSERSGKRMHRLLGASVSQVFA